MQKTTYRDSQNKNRIILRKKYKLNFQDYYDHSIRESFEFRNQKRVQFAYVHSKKNTKNTLLMAICINETLR